MWRMGICSRHPHCLDAASWNCCGQVTVAVRVHGLGPDVGDLRQQSCVPAVTVETSESHRSLTVQGTVMWIHGCCCFHALRCCGSSYCALTGSGVALWSLLAPEGFLADQNLLLFQSLIRGGVRGMQAALQQAARGPGAVQSFFLARGDPWLPLVQMLAALGGKHQSVALQRRR